MIWLVINTPITILLDPHFDSVLHGRLHNWAFMGLSSKDNNLSVDKARYLALEELSLDLTGHCNNL